MLRAVRVRTFLALTIVIWLSLQLERRKLCLNWHHMDIQSCTNLTEVHNDCTVYGFSFCYTFVKPCKNLLAWQIQAGTTGSSLQLLLWGPQIDDQEKVFLPFLLLPLSVRLIYSLGWLVDGVVAPVITVKGLYMELHGHQRAQDGEGNQQSQM